MKRKFAVATTLLAACCGLAYVIPTNRSAAISSPAERPEEFDAYWFRGEAEITSYTLEQARYGEIHAGDAVMVFVTEPFSTTDHVKVDRPDGTDELDVLKLNFTRSFNTGVYPYSVMTSTFTPLDSDRPMKVTTSSQEWCGHTFTQLNAFKRGYRMQQYSYFESEGDVDQEIEPVIPEDGLWTLIRTMPLDIPTGKQTVLPGTQYLRFSHLPPVPQAARIELSTEGTTKVLHVSYAEIDRELVIRFNAQFPHEIHSWQESYTSGWGEQAKRLVTKGTLNKRMKLDYWNRNSNADAALRRELGLD